MIFLQGICPGLVKTELGNTVPEIKNYMDTLAVILPEDIADGLMYALGTRPEVQVQNLNFTSQTKKFGLAKQLLKI